jgi:S-adenosyl-L-methionine hydrolase (adenosine-forming)
MAPNYYNRAEMAPPIVALLTDFGNEDPYVGAMKGAILTVCPEITLVDVVHELPAHDVLAGALALEAVHRTFPPGTIFAAVVDPGVGGERRGLALQAGPYRFVGPDNGIFTLVLETTSGARIHSLTDERLFRLPVSPVFHGRDVFGPVAGHLARGLPLEATGPAVHDPVRLSLPPCRRGAAGEWEAVVLYVDHFGSLTTNLGPADLEAIAATAEGGLADLVVRVGDRLLPLARTYADVPEGEPCALVGSGGRLEIAVNQGSATRLLGASRGTPVHLSLRTSDGAFG